MKGNASVLDIAWWTGSAVRHLPTSVLCGIMPSGAMRKSEARPLDFGSCESNRTGESAVSCVKLLSREIALVRFVFESRGESSIRWPNFDEFIRTWMPESRRQLLLDRGTLKIRYLSSYSEDWQKTNILLNLIWLLKRQSRGRKKICARSLRQTDRKILTYKTLQSFKKYYIILKIYFRIKNGRIFS